MNSGLFKLGWRDLLKGAFVSIVFAVLMYLKTSIGDHTFTLTLDTLKTIGSLSISTLIAYLMKQLLTDEEGKLNLGAKKI